MNNPFLNKTVKTFLTSLIVSVFIFGSFYFLLSEPETSKKEITPSNSLSAKSDTSKKLVVKDEEEEKEEELLAKNNSVTEDRAILGATTTGLLAQIPGDSGITPTPTQATQIVVTQAPAAITTLPATSRPVATGVPQTGNETLYIILGVFSVIAGFLIVNGKSIAMRSFEHQEI
jgi:hypothetical protein